MSLSELLKLMVMLGPKFKEALPLILALIKLFSSTAGENGGAVSYSMPATPSPEYQAVIAEGTKHGADENMVHELAQLVQARQ